MPVAAARSMPPPHAEVTPLTDDAISPLLPRQQRATRALTPAAPRRAYFA